MMSAKLVGMPVDYQSYATLPIISVYRTVPRIARPRSGTGPSSGRHEGSPTNITPITDLILGRTEDRARGCKCHRSREGATATLLERLTAPP